MMCSASTLNSDPSTPSFTLHTQLSACSFCISWGHGGCKEGHDAYDVTNNQIQAAFVDSVVPCVTCIALG